MYIFIQRFLHCVHGLIDGLFVNAYICFGIKIHLSKFLSFVYIEGSKNGVSGLLTFRASVFTRLKTWCGIFTHLNNCNVLLQVHCIFVFFCLLMFSFVKTSIITFFALIALIYNARGGGSPLSVALFIILISFYFCFNHCFIAC